MTPEKIIKMALNAKDKQEKIDHGVANSLVYNCGLSNDDVIKMLDGYTWMEALDTGRYATTPVDINGRLYDKSQKEIAYYLIVSNPPSWPMPQKVLIGTIWE